MNISYIGSGLSPFGEAMTAKEQRELKEATASISPSAQQSPMPAKATASTGSRISFVGHSPSFNNWVFNVNGRDIVANNYSTSSPLQLSFKGYFDKPTFTPIKTSGFDITDSTGTNMIWQWNGKQYASWWKAIFVDEEDPDAEVILKFGPPVPYTGPARAPVGDEVKTTPPVQGGGESQTRRTPSGSVQCIGPNCQMDGGATPSTPTNPTPAPAAKSDLLSLAIKLGSVYMLLK
jgi:hypothetical protein